MKYLKILGLAAVAAAALMAFVGAGTASAETTACKVTEAPCKEENRYKNGTKVVAHLEIEPAKLTAAGGLVEITCSKSTIDLEVTRETTPTLAPTAKKEGEPEPPPGLTFEECNNTVEVLEAPRLVIHHDEKTTEGGIVDKHNGEITVESFKVRVNASGLICTFGGEIKEGLTLTGGSTPTVDATATIPLKEGFFCPSTAVWHAKYEVTEPKPLYITTGV
jgi:hypothetical protein